MTTTFNSDHVVTTLSETHQRQIRDWLLRVERDPRFDMPEWFYMHANQGRIAALQYDRFGTVCGYVDPRAVLACIHAARIIGDNEFSMYFVYGNRHAVVNGMKVPLRNWFELIGPMTLLAWRAEQNAQR